MQCKRNLLLSILRGSYILVFACMLLSAFTGPAWSGGLYISEFGTPSMGVASAGSQAVASDASTAFHNPAGMTRIKGKELMLTGGALYSTVKFDKDADTPIDGGNGGDAGGPAPILGQFYVHSLSDRFKLGANLISITGAILDYDDDWTGRYLNTDVTLITVTLNPTLAYRVTDWLSIGGGPQIMYANLEMKLKAPPPNGTGEVKIDGDDIAFGYDVGALIELSEKTRLGIIYQSEIEPEFSGDVKFSGGAVNADAGTDTKITLARFIRASIYHELNNQWALLGSVGWEDWSAFKNINISTGQGSQKIPRNWDDTYKFAVGVHFRPVEKWLLQLGFAYDTSPVDSKDRTPDMPIDRQIRYATGVQYQWNEDVSLGGQFVYADYGDAKIKNDLLRGDYERNDLFFLAFNVNWKF
ncbi:MAG: outer membrane protein transport protein [Desulfobacterales bacterium]